MYTYHIVILSFNHPDLTARTVESVLALNFPAEQIILVHNGSEQKNVLLLNKKFPAITHAEQAKNNGFSGGANFGLSQAFKITEHVLFLTNDTEAIALPYTFASDADFFSVRITKRNSLNIDSVMGEVDLRSGKLTHLRNFDLEQKSANKKYYVPGTAFGMTKKAFQTVGGFDETFHTYWEDVDFSLQAQNYGLKLYFDSNFQVKHKIGKTCHKQRYYTLYLFQRNKKRFLKRHGKAQFVYRPFYYFGMLKLFFKLILKPNRTQHLNLWWSALCD